MSSAGMFSDYVMCPLQGGLLQRKYQNIGHPTVTLDQEQKEELLYKVFEEYGDEPIPKS
jgi:hypothetical protein